MNEVEIIKEMNCDWEELEELESYIDFVLSYEKLDHVLFNVILVDDAYIHKINLEYRGMNRPTDVITFALEDEKSVQAKEYGHSRKRELFFLVTHGIYHLLGYDHMTKEEEKIMIEKQEKVLNE